MGGSIDPRAGAGFREQLGDEICSSAGNQGVAFRLADERSGFQAIRHTDRSRRGRLVATPRLLPDWGPPVCTARFDDAQAFRESLTRRELANGSLTAGIPGKRRKAPRLEPPFPAWTMTWAARGFGCCAGLRGATMVPNIWPCPVEIGPTPATVFPLKDYAACWSRLRTRPRGCSSQAGSAAGF
jgi:hypothetical protein